MLNYIKYGEPYTKPFGGSYVGYWVNDKKHGKGKHNFACGASYEGNWENGEMHGRIKNTDESGNVSEEFWINGK